MARGCQLTRDLLVVQAIISQQDRCRPQGHALLRLPGAERRFELLPLFKAQLHCILWT